MNPAASPDWLDPFVANLLTAVALLAAGFALGGWLAWRRSRAGRRDADKVPSGGRAGSR